MGRFAFAGIAAGNYSLVAAKAAYVQAFYGSKHAGRGPGHAALDRQRSEHDRSQADDAARWRGHGQGDRRLRRACAQRQREAPSSTATYRAKRTLQPVGVGNIVTDDRGIYRAYGLTPGAYVVSLAPPIYGGLGSDLRMLSPNDMQAAIAAVQQGSMQSGATTPGATVNALNRPAGGAGAAPVMPPPGKAVGYSTVYYPGTWSSLDAQVVNVSAGQELAGIDIPVHLLPMSRLEGTVIGTDGQPAAGAALTFDPGRPEQHARKFLDASHRAGRQVLDAEHRARPLSAHRARRRRTRRRRRRTGRRCGCGAGAAASASPATATAWRERDQLWRRHLRGRRAGGAPLRAAGAGFRRRGRYRCHADAAGRHDGLRQDRLRGPDADGAGRSVAIVDRAHPRRAARDSDRPAYRADNADGRVHDVRRHAWQVPAHGERARQHRLDAEVGDRRRTRRARHHHSRFWTGTEHLRA